MFEIAGAAVAAIGVVALVVKFPTKALFVAIPLLMWPNAMSLAGLPLQQLLTVFLVVGLVISGRRRLRSSSTLLTIATVSLILVALSHFARSMTLVMAPTEARNSMLTLALNIAIVVGVAVAPPNRLTSLKVLGLSGALAAAYLAIYGQETAGRLGIEGLNPNSAGHAAAVAVVVLIGVFITTREFRWLALTVVPLWAVAASQSRGALVVLLVGCAVMFLAGRRGLLRLALGGLALAIGAIVWTPAVRFVQEYLLTQRDPGFVESESRSTVLELSFRLISDNPVFGIGYGRFLDATTYELGRPLNTHNDWVRLAVECGIVALALLVVLVVLPIIRDRDNAKVQVASRAVLAAVCTSFLFANTITDLRVSLPAWLLAGLWWSEHARPSPDNPSGSEGNSLKNASTRRNYKTAPGGSP